MKTTVEIPEQLLRQVRAIAAMRSISFKQLLIEALKKFVVEATALSTQPEWQRCFGAFKDSTQETAAIQKVIDTEFSRIDSEDWA